MSSSGRGEGDGILEAVDVLGESCRTMISTIQITKESCNLVIQDGPVPKPKNQVRPFVSRGSVIIAPIETPMLLLYRPITIYFPGIAAVRYCVSMATMQESKYVTEQAVCQTTLYVESTTLELHENGLTIIPRQSMINR